ncbi:MAG: LCP family protein [Negativicutes bacterium]|nr:LCP family protein [Negativicutes bacterium]
MSTRLEKRIADQRQIHKKRLLVIIAALLVFSLAAGLAYYWLSGGLLRSRLSGGLLSSPHKINILVLGVDEREGDVGRSDTTFLLTVDTSTKDVAMLSIPRDTRVKIPGFGWDKINHAYPLGKAKLAQKAAEDLLGIPIDYYVVINFAGFYKIVDAVGGVDINVEKRMYYQDPYDDDGGLVINLRPGMQHMDGKTAIQYVRYRDEEGDIGRVQRQQKFVKAMLQQVTSPGVIVRVPAIIREVSAAVQTSLSTSDMLSMAKLLSDAQKQGMVTDMVPGTPAYISDVSYWLPDVVALRHHIAQLQGGALEGKNLAEAQQLADEYQRSIPREMRVVEVPKSLQTKPASADPAKTGDAAKAAKPPVPDKITVAVINASGNASAAAKMVAALKNQGFEVAGVTTAATVANNTVVVSYTTSSAVINKLTGMPFKYVLQVTRDDTKATQVAVMIGKDYN